LREWDAVLLLEVRELEGSALGRFELIVPVAGAAAVHADEGVPRRAVERIAEEVDAKLERPYEVLLVRTDARRWSAGARKLRGDTVALPAGFPASSLEVVRPPGGGLEVTADGEPVEPALSPLFAEVVAELDGRGRERFESFVVRADKVADGSWQLTIDPL
jgi:hypothetical protein